MGNWEPDPAGEGSEEPSNPAPSQHPQESQQGAPPRPGDQQGAGPGYPAPGGPGYGQAPGGGPDYGAPAGPGYPAPGGPGYGAAPGAGPGYQAAAGPGYPAPGGPGYGPQPGPGYPAPGGPGYGPPAGPGYGGPGYRPPSAGGGSKKWLWFGLGGAGVVVVLIVVIVLVATSGGGPKPAPSRSPVSAPSSPASPSAAPSGGQGGGSTLTGLQLNALLPGKGELPGGWTIASQTGNSGGSLNTPDPSSAVLPGEPCNHLPNEGADTLLQDNQASNASESVNAGDQTPDVVLAGFFPGDAQKQLSEVKKHVAGCPQFSGKDASGKSGTFTASATPASVNGADQAIVVKVQSSTFYGSYTLLAQYGNVVVGVDEPAYDSQSSDTGSFASLAATVGQRIRSQGG